MTSFKTINEESDRNSSSADYGATCLVLRGLQLHFLRGNWNGTKCDKWPFHISMGLVSSVPYHQSSLARYVRTSNGGATSTVNNYLMRIYRDRRNHWSLEGSIVNYNRSRADVSTYAISRTCLQT
eukprot:scaffold9441_cov167-Amphora_coffeaeformis.AAC.13